MPETNQADGPDKPKLIVDEDWKSQVQRERDESKQRLAAENASAPAAGSGQVAAESKADRPAEQKRKSGPEELPPPPPASFPFLVSMLGTQALAAMGQLGQEEDAPSPRLDYAKHYIDLLGVLEDKTKNNLAPEESKLLGDWLYQLRIGYVEVAKHLG